MHRHRIVLVVGVVASVAAAACWLTGRPEPVPVTTPVAWPVAELPPHLYRSGEVGVPVRVAFPLALVATADPLVWHYHPGYPPKIVPATYRIHFAVPPVFPATGPAVVEGVAAFEFDGVRRITSVPGVVVLTSAVLRESP